ncbi:helix-hairpin-helix domain-containing protein [Streptomyces sp. E11-3]|uniref:ComEA family DNA-binding protein n=1 Tax=Streptomyces sp. E11-3 TaxID=3110112 RepID=UPI00398044B9
MRKDSADLPARKMSPEGSVWWALIPLLTLGMGTAFVLGWAAYRLRSRGLAIIAGVAFVAMLVALPLSGAPGDSAGSAVSGALIIALASGGLAATFLIRPRLVDRDHVEAATRQGWGPQSRPAPSRPAWAPRPGPGLDPAIGEALSRRQRRIEARRLLAEDPALARELRIGRPDLPRRYDDGGLVDVNHVPAAILASLPGFTPELADRVVRVRDEHHGFELIEELSVYADLPGGLADELAERLIFR